MIRSRCSHPTILRAVIGPCLLIASVLAMMLLAGPVQASSTETGGIAAESTGAATVPHSSGHVTSPDATPSHGIDEHASPPAEGAAAHGGEAKEAVEQPELPNFIYVLLHMKIGGKMVKDTPIGHFMHVFEKQILLLVVTAALSLFIFGTLHLRAMMPGKMQMFLEMVVEGFYSFCRGILGSYGYEYAPFIGTLFIFIFCNNIMGIIPLMGPPTAKYQTTVALAIMVFLYVQYQGIRKSGIVAYIDHFAGCPRDIVGWCTAPLLMPIHIIGELAKPLSLSLRLYGNIMGEDILIGVFLMLGMSLGSVILPSQIPVGIPLHLPFYFLALITCTIQALVFTLLSAIYIMLMLPHEEHGHE